jgi:hypothetical protein
LSPLTDPAKKLHALIRRIRGEYAKADQPPLDCCPDGHDPLLWQLVFSFMCWEASTAKAAPATKKLHAAVIDYNELRVCLPDELVGMIGERYPRATERVQRLRATLCEIFRRENAVTIHHLPAMPKREARAYLESLDGLPPFVAARMMLLNFGGHAFPLDERIYHTLLEEHAIPEGDFEELSSWLERTFHAGEALQPYLLLESWLNDRPAPKPSRKGLVIKPLAKSKPDAALEKPKRPLGEKGDKGGNKAANT